MNNGLCICRAHLNLFASMYTWPLHTRGEMCSNGPRVYMAFAYAGHIRTCLPPRIHGLCICGTHSNLFASAYTWPLHTRGPFELVSLRVYMAFTYAGPIRTRFPPRIHGLCIRGAHSNSFPSAYTWPLHTRGPFELVSLRVYMAFAYAGPIRTRFPPRIHGLCIRGAHSNSFPSAYTWPLHTRGPFELVSLRVYMAFAYAGPIRTRFPPRIHGLCIRGAHSNSFPSAYTWPLHTRGPFELVSPRVYMAFAYAGPIRTHFPPRIHGLCIRGAHSNSFPSAYTWPLHTRGPFELVSLRVYMAFTYAGPIRTRFPPRIHGLCIRGAHSNSFPPAYTWPLHTRGPFELVSLRVYMAFTYAGPIRTRFPPCIHGLCIRGAHSNSFPPAYTWPLHTRGPFELISPRVYMAFAYAGPIRTHFPPRIHGLCIRGA